MKSETHYYDEAKLSQFRFEKKSIAKFGLNGERFSFYGRQEETSFEDHLTIENIKEMCLAQTGIAISFLNNTNIYKSHGS